MQEEKFDMEVTEYRGKIIWETLAMLYVDQTGQEVKNIRYLNKVEKVSKKDSEG